MLTCPCLSISLLVSLTFSKDTTCLRSWSPVNGESGWVYSLCGAGGSALPATNHDERWYAYRYRLLSTGTMSMSTAYRWSARSPVNDTLTVGNILLRVKKKKKFQRLLKWYEHERRGNYLCLANDQSGEYACVITIKESNILFKKAKDHFLFFFYFIHYD